MIRLAYGTYGLGTVPLADAVPAIARAGFEAIELTLADGYPDVARRMDGSAGSAVAQLVAENGLELTAFLAKDAVLNTPQRPGMTDDALRELVASAQKCGAGNDAIVTFTMAGSTAEWPDRRDELVSRLIALGDIARAEGAILAVEPHARGLIDSVERAEWLMRAVEHPAVRLNFDISHYALPGVPFDLEDAARRLLPFSVHAHIKDSLPDGDGFRFVLPGEGPIDLVGFFATLGRLGWQRPITVEVSAMVFNAPGYRPMDALSASFAALDAARRSAAGIGRLSRTS